MDTSGNERHFVSFEEFVLSAEARGMTCPEFAREVGIEENGIYVILTGDGKFRFFDGKCEIPCPPGFEISKRIGDCVQDSGIRNLTIPESVENIERYAFSSCPSLESVTIPKSARCIGEVAFFGCSLRSVSIPESVESIDMGAFLNCSSLRSVTIPKSV